MRCGAHPLPICRLNAGECESLQDGGATRWKDPHLSYHLEEKPAANPLLYGSETPFLLYAATGFVHLSPAAMSTNLVPFLSDCGGGVGEWL